MDNLKPEERWVGGLDGLRKKYLAFLSQVDREGIPDLVKYLEESDFFTAPGSTKYHNAYPGGLVEHSLLVCTHAMRLASIYLPDPKHHESIVLTSLTHDLCKINMYSQKSHMVKNEGTGGIWTPERYYIIEDQFPYGHGEKSVLILQRFLKLTNDEIMAVRWHMGGFDDVAGTYAGGMQLRSAAETYPLVILLHMADLASCYLEVE